MSVDERACTYACLILHDDGIAITAEKIGTLVRAANVSVESYWPRLFAKLCEKKNLDELIMNIGAAGGGAAMDEKEWTIGLPKSLLTDKYEDSSSEWSDDEESQEALLLNCRSRDPYNKEVEKAVKLHRLKCTDWYRMRMDEINTPRPPPLPPLPPAPLSPPAGYMSTEEHNKAFAEILEEDWKSSSHDAVMSYLTKKLQKRFSLIDH